MSRPLTKRFLLLCFEKLSKFHFKQTAHTCQFSDTVEEEGMNAQGVAADRDLDDEELLRQAIALSLEKEE